MNRAMDAFRIQLYAGILANLIAQSNDDNTRGIAQNKMHMVSSKKKYIFHILFGVFQITPRIFLQFEVSLKSDSGFKLQAKPLY